MTRSAPRRFVNDINVTALLVIGSIPCSLEILGIIGVPLREVPIRRRSVDRKPYSSDRESAAHRRPTGNEKKGRNQNCDCGNGISDLWVFRQVVSFHRPRL